MVESKYTQLVNAMIFVESGDKGDSAHDGGKAYGILQLEPDYVKDAAKEAGQSWTHPESAKDGATSKKIMTAYMKKYATKKRLGGEPTAEDIARIHNGGPKGFEKESTEKYWDKVKERLEATGAHKSLTDGTATFNFNP